MQSYSLKYVWPQNTCANGRSFFCCLFSSPQHGNEKRKCVKLWRLVGLLVPIRYPTWYWMTDRLSEGKCITQARTWPSDGNLMAGKRLVKIHIRIRNITATASMTTKYNVIMHIMIPWQDVCLSRLPLQRWTGLENKGMYTTNNFKKYIFLCYRDGKSQKGLLNAALI